MRPLFLIFAFLLTTHAHAQSNNPGRRQPDKATGVKLVPVNTKTIGANAAAWFNEKNENPANADAWLNYFLWTERDMQLSVTEKKERLEQAITDAGKHITQTPQYHLMRFLQSGKKDSIAIYTALSFGRDQQMILPYAIQFSIISGNQDALYRFCSQLHGAEPVGGLLYEYHYNALQSASENGIIYAQGLTDLVPMAVLQQVHGIRRDIRLAYYNGNMPERENSYLCLSIGRNILEKYAGSTYAGLLANVRGKENIADFKMRFEKKFKLVELEKAVSPNVTADALNKNYLPSFILLYREYTRTNEMDKAAGIRKLIEKIAARSGNEVEVKKRLDGWD